MIRKNVLAAVLAVLVLLMLLAAVAGQKTIYNLYRDVSYYFGERTPAERTVKAYAEEMRISYGEYPFEIIDFLEQNPEAERFVLHYPFRKGPDRDLSGYGRETVPLFLQWDPKWGYETYGSNRLAVTGCGPTALAMAGYYLTGDPAMNPLDVALFAQENGYYAPGHGTSWTLISQGAARLGLTATELPLMEQRIADALNAGAPVILALGPGDFTTQGHYIVLTAAEEGGFRVNDPNSPALSAKLWTYEELEPQIRNIWAIGT